MSKVAASLSIGQVAERTGLSVHALRFYEREGVLANPVRRGPGGRRAYSEDDVDWLTLCIILRASGMPLPAIRRYTELVREGGGNEGERLALLRDHQQHVLAQIGQLNRCLDLIRFKVGVYEDLLDRAAAEHGCVAASDATGRQSGASA
ncbi:MAG TPA: MerR family transcriptional regulator [Micromonosporaceae bacterium]|nr:MerR family transcriptional regulator [Micromonosporaceae bacterium]